jgi:hypothetical protein
MTAHHSITIELDGKLVSGTFVVAKELLSVSCGTTSRTTIYHGVRPNRTACILLRQIAFQQRCHEGRRAEHTRAHQ